MHTTPEHGGYSHLHEVCVADGICGSFGNELIVTLRLQQMDKRRQRLEKAEQRAAEMANNAENFDKAAR